MENEDLIKQLERRYNSLINLDGMAFFLGLTDYVKFIIETRKLVSIVDEYILKEKINDTKELKKFEDKAKKDLMRFGEKLLKEIEKLKSSQLENLILAYRLHIEIYGEFINVNTLAKIIVNIIKLIRSSKPKNIPSFIKKFPKETPKWEEEKEYYFLPVSYFNYVLEQNRLMDFQEIKVWNAWTELYPIYVAIHKREGWEKNEKSLFEQIEKYTEPDRVFSCLDFIEKISKKISESNPFKQRELEEENKIYRNFLQKVEARVKEGKLDKSMLEILTKKDDLETMIENKGVKYVLNVFKKEYLNYLTLVNDYLIQKLNEKRGEEARKKIKYKISFTEDGVLNFQGKNIQFQIDTNSYYLLKTIFKNPTKIWNYDEIAEDWGIMVDEKPPWKKFYNAGYQINVKVAKETTIKDFLKLTNKTVNINKEYLKS